MAFLKSKLKCWICTNHLRCYHSACLSLRDGKPSALSLYRSPRHWCLVERRDTLFSWVGRSPTVRNYLDRWKVRHLLYSQQENVYTSCCLLRINDDSSGDSVSDDADLEDDDLADCQLDVGDLFEDQYLNPSQGHRTFIIQPAIRTRRPAGGVSLQLTDECQLAEACSLVDALPKWTTVGKEIVKVPQLDKTNFFSKGAFSQVQSLVTQCVQKTAVFVNTSLLSGLQLATLQKAWHVPVYDRYTIILQIFRLRARTMEAKLQLKLAEIPYYRSRLRGMHIGTLDQQKGGLNYIGGPGETWMDTRYRIMAEKKLRICKKLDALKKKRHLLWQERKKKELPLVAVVGYTNAGKTSLIRALTKDSSLQPWEQVFATLDVTCHAGYLSNHMKVVYMDTVGFISNIPINLIESFSATLNDVSQADVIIHVKDISHPNVAVHRSTVIDTLNKLKLNPSLLNSIIEVNNKVDLVNDPTMIDTRGVYVSSVTGDGISELLQLIQDAVIKQTGRMEKVLKIPQSGPHLAWLYREATVRHCQPIDSDSESLLVAVVITTAAYEKFCAQFSNKKKRK